jgi:hypothetical protein
MSLVDADGPRLQFSLELVTLTLLGLDGHVVVVLQSCHGALETVDGVHQLPLPQFGVALYLLHLLLLGRECLFQILNLVGLLVPLQVEFSPETLDDLRAFIGGGEEFGLEILNLILERFVLTGDNLDVACQITVPALVILHG